MGTREMFCLKISCTPKHKTGHIPRGLDPPLAPPTGSAAVSSRAAADAGEPDYKQTLRVQIVATVH